MSNLWFAWWLKNVTRGKPYWLWCTWHFMDFQEQCGVRPVDVHLFRITLKLPLHHYTFCLLHLTHLTEFTSSLLQTVRSQLGVCNKGDLWNMHCWRCLRSTRLWLLLFDRNLVPGPAQDVDPGAHATCVQCDYYS